jgi:hypothetical protein
MYVMFRLHFAISRLLPLTQNFSFLLCEAAAAAKKSDMTICHGVRMQKRIGKISFSFICVLDNPSRQFLLCQLLFNLLACKMPYGTLKITSAALQFARYHMQIEPHGKTHIFIQLLPDKW